MDRISTANSYNAVIANMMAAQSQLNTDSNQLSSGQVAVGWTRGMFTQPGNGSYSLRIDQPGSYSIHAALAAFWRETGDHASLCALAPDARRGRSSRQVTTRRCSH